eukprot:scaffold24286_cov111-Isochrysis_galbana.AAC.3
MQWHVCLRVWWARCAVWRVEVGVGKGCGMWRVEVWVEGLVACVAVANDVALLTQSAKRSGERWRTANPQLATYERDIAPRQHSAQRARLHAHARHERERRSHHGHERRHEKPSRRSPDRKRPNERDA